MMQDLPKDIIRFFIDYVGSKSVYANSYAYKQQSIVILAEKYQRRTRCCLITRAKFLRAGGMNNQGYQVIPYLPNGDAEGLAQTWFTNSDSVMALEYWKNGLAVSKVFFHYLLGYQQVYKLHYVNGYPHGPEYSGNDGSYAPVAIWEHGKLIKNIAGTATKGIQYKCNIADIVSRPRYGETVTRVS